jgi:hypothetical protein
MHFHFHERNFDLRIRFGGASAQYFSPLIASWEKICFALVLLKAANTYERACVFVLVCCFAATAKLQRADRSCVPPRDWRRSFVLAL